MLVRLVACGVCHTDMYTASGADPSGYAPAVLGHEGAGVVEAIGEGVKDLTVGDHVVTLFSPQCRECVHCLSPRTNLCMAIREQQNQGHLPDGTTRLSPRRRADPPLHGHEHVRRVHGDAGDRAGQGPAGGAAGPLRACSPAASRPASARRCSPPRSRPGSTVRRVRRRHGRPRRRRGRAAAGRRADHLRRPLRGPAGARARPGRDRHVDRRRGHRAARARRDRRLRRRLHVRGHRARARDAPGRRVRAHGLGPVHGRGRGRQGRDARHRPALPDHRPARVRLVASAASRAATRSRSSCSATSTATSTSTRSSRTGSRSTRSTTASS